MNKVFKLCERSASVATCLALSCANNALAAYPDKVVRIVVPYTAGGGVDLIARALAHRLAQRWDKPVIVDNRPGASTNIGAGVVAKSKGDGYTLLLTTDATVTTNPHLFKKIPYDPAKDLIPLVHVVNLNLILAVNPKLSVHTIDGLVALAKSGPPLNYSSSGNGSQAHLMFEALNRAAGIRLTHIPYSGIAPALQAVVSGEVQMTLVGGTSVGFVQSGTLRAIAVSGDKRVAALPNVPTFKEAGFAAVDPRGWVGLFAPAGLPSEVAAKIETDVRAVLADPSFQKTHLENPAFSMPPDTSRKAFVEYLRQDTRFKQKLIETAKVQLD
ncbi:tripartite tricarboxylate transporter substrate binding protein [Cupriavidus sp. L7L]|uniref:Bug family tripartite tricarboxylate transporter substrate binding protein n=1 Tax=Cupriavidus sp. L7L TaxID=2546443 RepID=UPI0014050357|nr:tripartite tricarboxylate transporter substrate binding protein [Cupriavidus sp. L7L]